MTAAWSRALSVRALDRVSDFERLGRVLGGRVGACSKNRGVDPNLKRDNLYNFSSRTSFEVIRKQKMVLFVWMCGCKAIKRFGNYNNQNWAQNSVKFV